MRGTCVECGENFELTWGRLDVSSRRYEILSANMKLSEENKRLTDTDNPELALTKGQQQVFAHWEEGFKAQGRGVPFEDCPAFNRFAHKIKRLWREGWLCGAAVDRIKAGWSLTPEHTQAQ